MILVHLDTFQAPLTATVFKRKMKKKKTDNKVYLDLATFP